MTDTIYLIERVPEDTYHYDKSFIADEFGWFTNRRDAEAAIESHLASLRQAIVDSKPKGVSLTRHMSNFGIPRYVVVDIERNADTIDKEC